MFIAFHLLALIAIMYLRDQSNSKQPVLFFFFVVLRLDSYNSYYIYCEKYVFLIQFNVVRSLIINKQQSRTSLLIRLHKAWNPYCSCQGILEDLIVYLPMYSFSNTMAQNDFRGFFRKNSFY